MADLNSVPSYYRHDRHIYAFRHALNTVDVFLPKEDVTANNKWNIWIVYIHGGAWRDPKVNGMTIVPALHFIDPSKHGIPGVASINYGLSNYPDNSPNRASPKDPSRNNKHPNHVEDVVTALAWLQQKYNYSKDYVLAGHSCGATLAFQILSRSARNADRLMRDSPRAPYPYAVVGLHGIYDLKLLAKDFKDAPMYRDFLEGAFGENKCQWQMASPVDWPYNELWGDSRAVVLAHSDEDQLLNWNQTNAMEKQLRVYSVKGREDVIVKTSGQHDEIWKEGKEMARVLLKAVNMVRDSLEAHGRNDEYWLSLANK